MGTYVSSAGTRMNPVRAQEWIQYGASNIDTRDTYVYSARELMDPVRGHERIQYVDRYEPSEGSLMDQVQGRLWITGTLMYVVRGRLYAYRDNETCSVFHNVILAAPITCKQHS